jgi:hypothetical protein
LGCTSMCGFRADQRNTFQKLKPLEEEIYTNLA